MPPAPPRRAAWHSGKRCIASCVTDGTACRRLPAALPLLPHGRRLLPQPRPRQRQRRSQRGSAWGYSFRTCSAPRGCRWTRPWAEARCGATAPCPCYPPAAPAPPPLRLPPPRRTRPRDAAWRRRERRRRRRQQSRGAGRTGRHPSSGSRACAAGNPADNPADNPAGNPAAALPVPPLPPRAQAPPPATPRRAPRHCGWRLSACQRRGQPRPLPPCAAPSRLATPRQPRGCKRPSRRSPRQRSMRHKRPVPARLPPRAATAGRPAPPRPRLPAPRAARSGRLAPRLCCRCSRCGPPPRRWARLWTLPAMPEGAGQGMAAA